MCLLSYHQCQIARKIVEIILVVIAAHHSEHPTICMPYIKIYIELNLEWAMFDVRANLQWMWVGSGRCPSSSELQMTSVAHRLVIVTSFASVEDCF